MMTAFCDAMRDALDGHFRAGHDEEMEGNEEAGGFRFRQQAGIGLAAQCAFQTK
jgi:hypothetical protein